MDESFGDKALTILRRNPTVGQFAEEAGISLEDAYRLQALYVGFWQTLVKVRPVDKSGV